MVERPTTVTVVAAFLSMATVIAVATGTTLLIPGTRLDILWQLNRKAYSDFSTLGRTPGVLLLMVGCVTAAASAGLLRGRKWAWWVAIGIFVINGLGDLAALFVARDWIKGGSGVLIAAGFLFVLIRKKVRVFFARHG
jgi:hypothetical protein